MIGRDLGFYNSRRPHSNFDRQTPDRPTSTGCRDLRQPKPGRHPTYQTGTDIQTNRASSVSAFAFLANKELGFLVIVTFQSFLDNFIAGLGQSRAS